VIVDAPTGFTRLRTLTQIGERLDGPIRRTNAPLKPGLATGGGVDVAEHGGARQWWLAGATFDLVLRDRHRAVTSVEPDLPDRGNRSSDDRMDVVVLRVASMRGDDLLKQE
jgi:hypothetical protein